MKLSIQGVRRMAADFTAWGRNEPLPSEAPQLSDEERLALNWFERECDHGAFIQRKAGRWVIRVPRYELTSFSGDLQTQRQLVLHAYRTVKNT